jgi:nicotinate-nucleotide adenylyltransferase
MVRMAVQGDPESEVSTIEIEREGPSYTAETLQRLAQEHPGAELFFIIGEDALIDLPNWREPERIITLARLVVAPRPGPMAKDDSWRAIPNISERLEWLEMEAVRISASEVRRRLRLREPVDGMLPAPVEDYIRERGLYSR